MTPWGLAWPCCGFSMCCCLSQGELCVLQPGRVLWTHRCGAVELVVERPVGAKLRVDGRVGLQDSGAHVQNGRGTMVQTVLQNKAPMSAPKGDTCLDRAGTEPSQALVSQQSSPGLSNRGKRRKGLVGHHGVVPWPTPLLPTSAHVPSPPYQHFPVLAVPVEAEEVA